MARKNLIEVEVTPQEQVVDPEKEKNLKATELMELIPKYGEVKAIIDENDKIAKAQNAQIKSLMSELKMDSITATGWKATYSVSNRTTMNEDKLLAFVKGHPELAELVVKTKEYVDMEALESVIYANKVDQSILVEMKTCEETKQVETLRVTKVKEKKDGKES